MSKKGKYTLDQNDDYYSSRDKINYDNYQFLYDYVNLFINRNEETIKKSFQHHIKNTVKYDKGIIDKYSAYLAISYSIHDRLVQFFNVTMNYFVSLKAKQLNFVSSEFLLGRFLQNALLNLQLDKVYRKIFNDLKIDNHYSLDDIFEEEKEQGPGATGVGRFASCLFDSLATLNYPAWGYGIYYSKGYFEQKIRPDSSQDSAEPESYDKFLRPWYIERPSIEYEIGFGGKTNNNNWSPGTTIKATAYDFLIPGYHTVNTLALRLWSSLPNSQHSTNKYDDLSNLTEKILPSDSKDEKIKEIRFKQEYFLASATIQDILHRLENEQKASIDDLPKFVSIHMNDTQPCLMTIELLRILIDEKKMEFEEAFLIINQVFSFTCHSLIEITFEKWPISFFQRLLPRHLELIYQVNDYIMHDINNDSYKSYISIFEGQESKQDLRMINLAVICSHTVNGVSEIHTKMLKEVFFRQLNSFYPKKIINITNGISIRRWLHHCNNQLSDLITKSLNDDESWPVFNTANENNIYKFEQDNDEDDETNDILGNKNSNFNGYAIDPSVTENKWKRTSEFLSNLIKDKKFIDDYNTIRYNNKTKLVNYIKEVCKIELDQESMLFNIQAKEIKHHNLQTLQIFSIIHRYLELKESYGYHENKQPRAYIIAGKASPQSPFSTQLVRLINEVANVINRDGQIISYLRVIFLPNYNVSLAEKLVLGADVNASISTPDCEAGATTNMKFAVNGSLIIGSKGGTNIELRNEIGHDTVIEFGPEIKELDSKRSKTKSVPIYQNSKIGKVFDAINNKRFGDPQNYNEVINVIQYNDYQLVKASFDDYIRAQDEFDRIYSNRYDDDKNGLFLRRIKAIPHIGQLSSDRAAVEYAEKVWGIKQYPLPIDFNMVK